MNNQQGQISLNGIRKVFGNFEALKSINLEINPSEFFALLGPSGSGKSTTLRVIAGLETPDEGTIFVDDEDVTDSQPGDRDVAMVFQSYALYPHMTLAENIGFPLKMDGVAKSEIPARVKEAAAKVKIDHLLQRRPGQLSGGQQQRCALARAIVRQPKLFLLDEPLSNLDAQLRLETRVELKKLQRELDVTSVYVTHDQEEAMTLADRMAVFLDGEIAQVGTPDEVFNRPANMDVAAFIGSPPMNLIEAKLEGDKLSVGEYSLRLAKAPANTPTKVVLGIRPSHISLAKQGLKTDLYLSENLGEGMLLNCAYDDAIIKVRLPEVRDLSDGSQLHLSFDIDQIHLFDPVSRTRIEV